MVDIGKVQIAYTYSQTHQKFSWVVTTERRVFDSHRDEATFDSPDAAMAEVRKRLDAIDKEYEELRALKTR